MDEQLGVLAEWFGPDAVMAMGLHWGPRIVVALALLLVAWATARAGARVLTAVFARVELDPTAAQFVLTLLRFAIGIIGILAALDQLGVDTTSILASLGVMGLTFGFAAQDTLSNVISGLFIFWDRPFVIGDLVEVDGEYGRVETITLRSTRLVTPDGRMLAIPNQVIASGKVASYTNFPNLRIDLSVTVAVDTEVSRARKVLLSLVTDDPDYLAQPAPVVVVNALNDYNIELELRAWLDDETQHVRKRFALREAINTAFGEAGIDMPFETVQLQPLEIHQRAAG